jgi:hypothetical protein
MEREIAEQNGEASLGKLGAFQRGHLPHDGLPTVQVSDQEN